MVFASELEFGEGPVPNVDRSTRKGKWYKRTYSFTQGATDGGGTIATGILNGIKAVQATTNVVDKTAAATFVVATGVITLDIDTTAGPTAGWVDVLYLLK